MQIIDSHFHLYKSQQTGIMAQGGKSLIGFSGTFEEAVSILDRGKISRIIALAVIPISLMRQAAERKWPKDLTPSKKQDLAKELDEKMLRRLTDFNDWICRVARGDGRMEPVIAADASVDREKMAAEILCKIANYQIKTLKIHPAVNGLSPSYQGYDPIFEIAQQNSLVVISHGGASGEDPEGKYCSPMNFRKVLDRFPKLKLVIAHLAFPHVEGLLELASQYPNLYTDLSVTLGNMSFTDKCFCETIRAFGPERVFFGSDFPWSDPEKDLDRFCMLNLSDSELEMIAWKNAANIFMSGE